MRTKINEPITLPCLRGCMGDWIYYNIVLPFSELNRIDNSHIIKEAKSLDEWLQRKLSNRIVEIKNYLLYENERYFNSVIVGLYKDVPDWYALDLRQVSKKCRLSIPKHVEESLGILSLTGKEILFTIDGQHRIEGIRLALKENHDRFKDDELSIVLVAHKDSIEGRVRTRKLFATINREAVKPTPNTNMKRLINEKTKELITAGYTLEQITTFDKGDKILMYLQPHCFPNSLLLLTVYKNGEIEYDNYI